MCAPVAPGPALVAFAHAYAPAYCAWENRCYGDLYGFSGDNCAAWAFDNELNQDLTILAVRIADGLASFDPSAAQACVDQLNQAPCDVFLPAVCQTISSGLVPLGGTCYEDGDCLNGSCGPQEGLIQPPYTCAPYAELGDDCSQTECDPTASLACGDDYLCTAWRGPVGVGQPCGALDSTGYCGFGLYCTTLYSGIEGVCATSAALGDPCSPSLACAPGLACVAGANGGDVCEPVTGNIGDPRPHPAVHYRCSVRCLRAAGAMGLLRDRRGAMLVAFLRLLFGIPLFWMLHDLHPATALALSAPTSWGVIYGLARGLGWPDEGAARKIRGLGTWILAGTALTFAINGPIICMFPPGSLRIPGG